VCGWFLACCTPDLLPPLTRWQSQSCLPARIALGLSVATLKFIDLQPLFMFFFSLFSCWFGFGFWFWFGSARGSQVVRFSSGAQIRVPRTTHPQLSCHINCLGWARFKNTNRNTSKHNEKYLIKIYVQPQKQSQRVALTPDP